MRTGKVSESVLKRSVLRQLKTKRKEVLCGAGIGGDCALFALSDGMALASCAQEAAVAVQADIDAVTAVSIGHLIQKCANNLAVGGAEPIAAVITLLLPKQTEEVWIKQLMREAEEACSRLNMQIAGGQTRISEAVCAPLAVVTGYGRMGKTEFKTVGRCRAGQDIVLSKWIGLEGTAGLVKRSRAGLLERYPAYLVEEAAGFERYLSILPEAAIAVKNGVCAMHDASEGGIFAALWELAEGAGKGLCIDLKKLPIRQETVEVCEYCGVNPYELKSGGCLVMVCEDGEGMAEALRKAGIPAVVAGRLTEGNDRIIRNEDEVRYMERPRADELYKKV